jgi:hypothetical protein
VDTACGQHREVDSLQLLRSKLRQQQETGNSNELTDNLAVN